MVPDFGIQHLKMVIIKRAVEYFSTALYIFMIKTCDLE